MRTRLEHRTPLGGFQIPRWIGRKVQFVRRAWVKVTAEGAIQPMGVMYFFEMVTIAEGLVEFMESGRECAVV